MALVREDERLKRAWAEAIRNGTASPAAPPVGGMINQTAVTPEMLAAAAASTKGQEAGIAIQQAYAKELRDTAMPQGRQTGEIFTAANPLEFLGTLGNQAVGAIAARKIREEAIPAMDRAEVAKNMAGLQISDVYNNQGREDKAMDRAIDQQSVDISGRQADETARNNAATLAETIRANNLDAAAKQAQLAQSWGATAGEEYVDIRDPTGRTTVATIGLPGGGRGYQDETGKVVPLDNRYFIPLGDLVATKAEDRIPQNPVAGEGVTAPDVVTRILSSPVLEQATGVADPESVLGQWGYGSKGGQIQDLQRDMGTSIIANVATNLEALNLKPVSDTDRVLLETDVPNRKTQPYGWVGWAANAYRPTLERKFNEAVDAGIHTPESREQYLNQLDMAIVQQALQADYPLERLVTQGVNPEIIRYFQLLEKERN